ncbi:unnamed protein product [Callosobruchus maculatus]|uniref:Peptidase M12B domain-containing protein n=1 Tax=Callosobruchus maculatus TaxID=64391 RepID=A0A653CE88_CALMS|nr:unnamed protein product [Callosobruchus maculatus]
MTDTNCNSMSILSISLFTFFILGNRIVEACFRINQIDDIFPKNYIPLSTKIPAKDVLSMEERLRNHTFVFEVCPEESVCLKVPLGLRKLSILDQNLDIDIHTKERSKKLQLDKLKPIFVEGYHRDGNGENHVIGYIENNCFYGQVIMSDSIRVYYIEDIRAYRERDNIDMSRYNAVAYKRKRSTDIVKRFADVWLEDESDPFNFNPDYLYREFIKNGKVCTLFVLIDNSFLKILHDNDVKSAVTSILKDIDQVDSIFRSTDFNNDGVPDNIGFRVKYMAVLESESSPENIIPQYVSSPIAGQEYLVKFTGYEILKEVCLGVAFTAQPFHNNTLGVSYTALSPVLDEDVFRLPVGGLCDRSTLTDPTAHLNALVISSKLPNGKTVPASVSCLSLAHELGHSFGALHDTQNCVGFLMGSHTPEKEERQNYRFSECSKPQVVQTILNQGYCLEDSEGAFCGNGIIEEGEVCDCGTWRDCAELDDCCLPRGEKYACQVNWMKEYQCHPSQGSCCTQRCIYKDLMQYGVNCKNFERSCPCPTEERCSCGVDSECIGDTCHSLECTRLNLEECKCTYDNNMPEADSNSVEKCRTCCMFEGSCVSSSSIVDTISSRNEDIHTYLKQKYSFKKFPRNVKIKKFGYYKEFCNKTGGGCTLLFFREVKDEEFCILFGKIGTCRKSECDLPSIRQVFPDIIESRTSSASTNLAGKYFIVSLLLTLHIACKIC